MVRDVQGSATTIGRSRGETLGMVEVVFAMVLAGSSVVAAKLLSARMPVFLATELVLVAALLAAVPVQIRLREELRLLGGRELFFMFLQALFGIVAFRVLALYGLRWTSAVNAGLITSTAPAVMAILASVFFGERIGARGRAAVALAVLGLLLINLAGAGTGAARGSSPRGAWVGNLLVLGAVVCEALLTLFRKAGGSRIGSVTNTVVLVAMSALMMLPFALVELRSFDLGRLDPTGWLAILYYGPFATIVAYVLWGDGALRIPASRTGIAMAALPLSAVVLSALVLGERVGLPHAVGGAAVIAGIVLGRRQGA